MAGNSFDKFNFPHLLSLTDRQVARFCKAFSNNLSANTELSKTQISKMIQIMWISWRFTAKVGTPILAKNARSYFVNKKNN